VPKQDHRKGSKDGVYEPHPNNERQLAMNDPTLRDV